MKASHLRDRASSSLMLVAGLVALTPARADDLTVSGAQTTASTTATAANNSAGNISVASGGSIIVTTSGPAVTINSNNSVTNAGTISSSAVSGATGLLMSGTALTSASLINNGAISITGTGGSGNTGLLVSGDPITGSITAGLLGSISVLGDSALGASIAASFTGDISLRGITVSGASSTAASVTAPLTGNLTLYGVNTSSGAGGYGLLVTAPISGTVRNAGSLTAGTTQSVDATTLAAVPGVIALAGERIAASVGGGLLNDRYYIDATGVQVTTVDTTVDTLVNSTIVTSGTAPALWVAPNTAAPQAISIGAVGSGDDAYAIVNRGLLETLPGNTGLATVALLVGGGGATTTLAGGINSQATASIIDYSLNASATGIDLAAGAVVPALVNQGSLTVAAQQSAATSSVAIGTGGAAFGVVVVNGAALTSLINSGTISVTAAGDGNGATAIIDRSGTLRSITNSGTISAAAVAGAPTRAIDLSASTADVVVTNSGTITGDVVFGSGASTLALTGGKITGAVAFGTGDNLLAMSGTSTLATSLTSAAPLRVTLTDSAALDLTNNSASLGSLAASGNATLLVPLTAGQSGVVLSGAASFTGGSTITLAVQSLAQTQNLTIVTAAGGVSTDHLSTLINGLTSSYLFAATAPTLTDTTLSVSLSRKSAADIGLTGAQAALFDASIPALTNGSVEAIAVSNLSSQDAVVAAYRQITPPSFGRAPLRAAQNIADAGFGAASDRMSVIEDLRHGGIKGLGVWAQEVGNFGQQAAGTNETGFKSSGFGLAAGVDMPLLGLDAVGLGLVSNWTTVHQRSASGLKDVSLPIATLGIEPYASWSWKALFVQVSGLAAHVGYDTERTLTIGSLTDTVDANWTGTQFGAGATLGARFKLGRFRITPSNAVYWTSLRQGKYTETGGGNFDLAVAAQKDSVTSNTSKLSLAYLLPLGDGTIQIEGHGAYVHQFNAKPTSTVANFVSGGDAITLTGDDVDGAEHSFGGGLGYTQAALSFRAGYDRRQGDNFHDQAFVATIGLAF